MITANIEKAISLLMNSIDGFKAADAGIPVWSQLAITVVSSSIVVKYASIPLMVAIAIKSLVGKPTPLKVIVTPSIDADPTVISVSWL